MSGSAKASVLKAFRGFRLLLRDNLPVELIPRFAELVGQSSEITRTLFGGRSLKARNWMPSRRS